MNSEDWENSKTQKFFNVVVGGLLAIIAVFVLTAWVITACTAEQPNYPPGTECYNDGFSTVCE